MKLLFDENLSRTLVSRLQDLFPGSDHVVLLGLEQKSDAKIFQYAVTNGFVVVTKDSDFNGFVGTEPSAPGLIWIRTGNCSTDAVEHLIRMHHEQVEEISSLPTVRLLILF
jgi:predicted nuclease of predicted toxin-antitoxin system